MSKAKKNNAREQRRRSMRGDIPNSTKHAYSSISFVKRRTMRPTKPLKR